MKYYVQSANYRRLDTDRDSRQDFERAYKDSLKHFNLKKGKDEYGFYYYTIEVQSLEELDDLIECVGDIVIETIVGSNDPLRTIVIYDDYLE